MCHKLKENVGKIKNQNEVGSSQAAERKVHQKNSCTFLDAATKCIIDKNP